MPLQSNRINSATSFAFSTIAENGLIVQTGDLLSLNQNGFITKAKSNSVIIGICNTKNAFPANNETEEQFRVEYSPIVWENSYKMKISTDTSTIKVGQFYKITDNQEIDLATASPSVGQFMVQDVFSTYLEVRFVSSVGLAVPQYEDVRLVKVEPITTLTPDGHIDEAAFEGKYKFTMSNGTIIEWDFWLLNWRNKDIVFKKITVNEEISTEKMVAKTTEVETGNITTANIKTLNMKEEWSLIDAKEIKAEKATLSGLKIEWVATVDDNTFPTYQARSEKEQPNGYAALDQNGKIKETQYHEGMIKCMKWRGERDPQSGLLPTNPVHWDTYLVHANGVINGNKWTKGDLLVYDGANNGEWNRVPVGDTEGLELVKNKVDALDFNNPSREKYPSELAVVEKFRLIDEAIKTNKDNIATHQQKILDMYNKTEVLFLINKTFDAIKDAIALLQNQVNYQNFITKLIESLKNGGLTKEQIEAILGAGNFFVEGIISNSNTATVSDPRITEKTFVSAIVPDNAKWHISVEVQTGKIIISSTKTETNVPVSVLLTNKK